jgi:glutamate--cysteine ligase
VTALPTATPADPLSPVRSEADAEAYVASVCFKHGPPRLLGVELEWTVHHAKNPSRPLDADHLADALGPHTPTTLRADSPHEPLPNGSIVTLEPGGQVEISTPPRSSLAGLISTASSDIAHLTESLRVAGLTLGSRGLDPYRPPHRLLKVPRYAAMESAFDRIGPDGRTMMCSTAGLQVCVDAGERGSLPRRWAAAHALGPVLMAAFANSPQSAGRSSGWASARMRALLATDPPRTRPAAVTGDVAAGWARRVLNTPLVCLRRPGDNWEAPSGITFADWIAGALPCRPTTDDLDYHLTTLFPPVRPRGYFELRYLDTQPAQEWVVPVAVAVALFGSDSAIDAVLDVTAPTAGHWVQAAMRGLGDPGLAKVAGALFDLANRLVERTDLSASQAALVAETLDRRLGNRRQS